MKTRVQTPSQNLFLTDRDRKLLVETFRSKFVTRDLTIGLGLFASISRSNHRLLKLLRAGYLRRTFIASGSSSVAAVYMLGPSAASIVADALGLDTPAVLRMVRTGPSRQLIEHALLALEIRIAFENHFRPPLHLRGFLVEAECRHEFALTQSGVRSEHVLKPDSMADVAFKGQSIGIFVEADRSHVSRSGWKATVERFDIHHRLGLTQEVFGVSRSLVVVVTTGGPGRLQSMAAIAARTSLPFLFTTVSALRTRGLSGAIFVTPDCRRERTLAHILETEVMA